MQWCTVAGIAANGSGERLVSGESSHAGKWRGRRTEPCLTWGCGTNMLTCLLVACDVQTGPTPTVVSGRPRPTECFGPLSSRVAWVSVSVLMCGTCPLAAPQLVGGRLYRAMEAFRAPFRCVVPLQTNRLYTHSRIQQNTESRLYLDGNRFCTNNGGRPPRIQQNTGKAGALMPTIAGGGVVWCSRWGVDYEAVVVHASAGADLLQARALINSTPTALTNTVRYTVV